MRCLISVISRVIVFLKPGFIAHRKVDWFRDADKIPLNPPLIKGEAKVLSFNKVGSENRFLFQREK
jgi:hypothetical protein